MLNDLRAISFLNNIPLRYPMMSREEIPLRVPRDVLQGRRLLVSNEILCQGDLTVGSRFTEVEIIETFHSTNFCEKNFS